MEEGNETVSQLVGGSERRRPGEGSRQDLPLPDAAATFFVSFIFFCSRLHFAVEYILFATRIQDGNKGDLGSIACYTRTLSGWVPLCIHRPTASDSSLTPHIFREARASLVGIVLVVA